MEGMRYTTSEGIDLLPGLDLLNALPGGVAHALHERRLHEGRELHILGLIARWGNAPVGTFEGQGDHALSDPHLRIVATHLLVDADCVSPLEVVVVLFCLDDASHDRLASPAH